MLKKLDNLFKEISFHALPLGFLFLISLIIIISWFRYGYFYGGGDVGLPTYDPARILSIVKNIWWDAHSPGFSYPGALTSIPYSLFLTLLQIFGLSAVIIQAILFGSLLFLTGIGMYFLFFEVATSNSKTSSFSKSRTLSFIAAIFYMLNPYMVTQVWHRFVHTAFFLAALVPILMFVYIKIVKTHSFFWFLGFIIISFVFSYAYGSLPFMVVIWIPLLFYSFWKAIETRSFKGALGNALIFLLVFVSWLISNTWWLYPFWTTGPAIFSQMHSIYSSIATLLSLSNQNSMAMVLRGINPFYTFGEEAWVLGYDHFLMQLISWTIPLVTLIGIYSILADKKRTFYIWILLFLIGIFVSKGNAAPFGYPFLLTFTKSFIFGAFRNPFEKFGVIIPFASAFIFPLGIRTIFLKLRGKYKGIKYLLVGLISILLFLEFGIYDWPVWTGKMFGTSQQPAFVQIPDSYKEANQWIKAQGKQGRILQIPFATGDAVTYKWEMGYDGIEPSPLLFTTPSVSNSFGFEQLDHSLASINTVFTSSNFDQKRLANVLSNLNIRYIILHRDTDWRARGLIDPDVLLKVLDKVDFIQKKETFGELIVYEINDSLFTPKIFTENISNVLTGDSTGFSVWPEIYEDKNWPVFFASAVNGNEDELSRKENLDFSATAIKIIQTPGIPLAYKENALSELAKPRFLPDSPLYPLILIKEQMQLLFSLPLSKHYMELDRAGKRLAEAHALIKNGKIKLADRIMANYISEFNDAMETVEQTLSGKLIENTERFILETTFARQRLVLEEINNKEALENMKLKLSGLGFIPYYELKEELGMSKYNRRVYRFDVQKDGSYEILLKNPESSYLYEGGLKRIPLQIDNEIKIVKTDLGKSFLSLGVIEFEKGLHEISYNVIDSNNLSPEKGVVEFNTSKQDFSSLSFPIENFNKNDVYRINLDFWIKNGQGPILQVMQDSDRYVKGKRVMSIDKLYDKDNYSFYWNSASILFNPRPNTTEAVVRILGEPWNNCLDILIDRDICEKKEISKAFNRESNFVIRNVSVKRFLLNDVLLRSPNLKSATPEIKNVSIDQKSPSYYEGDLNLADPTSLVFLTTFHPEWKLSLIKDGKTIVISEDNHFLANGYGNLWYLDEEPGRYKIEIEFLPQKRFYKGIAISLGGTAFLIVVVYIYIHKKKKWLNY